MIQKTIFGNPFQTYAITQDVSETAEIKYFSADKKENGIEFTYKLSGKDIVYGLGETTGGLDKRGGRYISWNTDTADHSPDNPSLYSSHNFLVIDGEIHFGIFFDTPGKVVFEIDCQESGEIKVFCESENIAVYQIENISAYEITKEFLKAIGPGYLPPLWAFGYGQSRFGYKNEDDFREVVSKHEEAGIPLDYVCMDIDYMDRYIDFTVNKKRFLDFKKFAEEMKQKGIRLVPITDAGLKVEKGNCVYEEGISKGYFCTNKENKFFQAGVWPGMTHFPDFLRKEVRDWFGNQYRFFTEQGIEGFWNDMNEPAVFYSEYTKGPKKLCFLLDMIFGKQREEKKKQRVIQDYKSFFHEGEKGRVCHYDVHNIYGYFMTMAVSEQLNKLLDHRFLLFARSSYIGAGRYGGIWTGDNSSCWEHLKLNLVQMVSLNMCGFLYAGADTGGFMGNITRELMLRWLAVSLFTPLMRNHSGMGTVRQECYSFGGTEDFRDMISLRYRLLPYIYSEYMKSTLRGDMYMKPLAFCYPEDERARGIDDQIIVGEAIMMVPILTEQSTSRSVYLPEDMTMVRYSSGEFYSEKVKKGEITIRVELNEVVFFILKDKLVPIGKDIKNSSEICFDNLTLLGDGSIYELYVDDGMTRECKLEFLKVLENAKN